MKSKWQVRKKKPSYISVKGWSCLYKSWKKLHFQALNKRKNTVNVKKSVAYVNTSRDGVLQIEIISGLKTRAIDMEVNWWAFPSSFFLPKGSACYVIGVKWSYHSINLETTIHLLTKHIFNFFLSFFFDIMRLVSSGLVQFLIIILLFHSLISCFYLSFVLIMFMIRDTSTVRRNVTRSSMAPRSYRFQWMMMW